MTCSRYPLQERVSEALFRSALYHALALGFEPPAAPMKHRIRISWGSLLEAPMTWPVGVKHPMAKAAEQLLATPADELAREYARIFDASDGCSLHESDHVPFSREECLAELNEYYEAFGLFSEVMRAGQSRLRDGRDSVGYELDFMGVLALKEAFALSREWYENLALMLNAQAAFMRHHLGGWLRDGLRMLRDRPVHPYYFYLGEATLFTLDDAAKRLNVLPSAGLSRG